MTNPNPAAQPVAADTLIENLSRIDEDDHERGCSGRYYSCSCGFDDHIYKTSRAAIAEIIRLQAEVDRLREITTFDCTGFPSMESAAIKWANKISGVLGGPPYHPDPVGILEMCEDIARAALSPGGE